MRQTSTKHPFRNLSFTYDASMFTYLPNNINREIFPDHVKTMVESIKLMGSLRVVICAHLPFIDPHDLFVLDGQHLIEGSMITGDEIAFIEISVITPEELIKTISLINSSAKSWTVHDFVKSWSWLSKHYKTLWKAFLKASLPIRAVACAFSMLHLRDRKVLESGGFTILDQDNGEIIIEHLKGFYKMIPMRNQQILRCFTEAYIEMYYKDVTGYNHKKFAEYVKRNLRDMVMLPDNKDKWLTFLKKYKLYNYKN